MKLSAPLVLAAVVAACGRGAPSPPGRAERLSVGSLEIYALEDGHLVVPNDAQLLGVGRAPDEIADVLAAAGLPRDPIRLDIQGLLVKTGDRVLLFDAGSGPTIPTAGRLPRSLARAGVAPGDVTDIFISHGHGDHVGGLLTPAGALAFPAATIHMSAPEWEAFRTHSDADIQRYAAVMTPKVAAFAPGAQLLPAVRAVATPGHTPGHSSYEITSDGETLFYLGDLAHHSVISVQRPAWSVQVDADRPAAAAMRETTLARLAATGTRVFAYHFPFPGVGCVVRDGDALTWAACAAPPPTLDASTDVLAELRARGYGAAADVIDARVAQAKPKMKLTAEEGLAAAAALLALDRPAVRELHAVMPRSTVELARAVAERGVPADEAETIARYLVRVVATLAFERLATFDDNHSHVTGRDWPDIDYTGEGMTWRSQRDTWAPRGVTSFQRATFIHAYFVGAERLPHWQRVYRPRGKMRDVPAP